MIRFQFNQFKGTITQALIVIKSVQIDDFWTLDMSISTLDMSVSTLDMLLSTLDMLLSTLDSRPLPRLSNNTNVLPIRIRRVTDLLIVRQVTLAKCHAFLKEARNSFLGARNWVLIPRAVVLKPHESLAQKK